MGQNTRTDGLFLKCAGKSFSLAGKNGNIFGPQVLSNWNRGPDEGSRFTVGGFYGHFKLRDALVAEAGGSSLDMWKDRIDASAAGGPRITYESLVDDYLSEAHRNYPGMGCPVAALAGDLARRDKHTRAVVTRKTRDNIELLASLIRDTNKTDKDTARSCAVMAYCTMVGAISMARAVSDKELSREILKTVAQRLKPGTTREQREFPSLDESHSRCSWICQRAVPGATTNGFISTGASSSAARCISGRAGGSSTTDRF
jgi:TetR/AcrR family transcriptional repressor of nem operon